MRHSRSLATRKRGLALLTAAAVGASCWVTWWGATARPASLPAAGSRGKQPAGQIEPAGPAGQTTLLTELPHAWTTRRLRRPLFDPPPPPPPPVVKPVRQPPRIKLLATMIEQAGKDATAMIQLPDGSIQYKKQGDPIDPDGTQVTQIEAGRIVVAHGEESFTFEVAR